MNTCWNDEGCSNCVTGDSLRDSGLADPWAMGGSELIQHLINEDLGCSNLRDDTPPPSFVVCYPETSRDTKRVFAADDLISNVDANLLRFDRYSSQTDPLASFDYNDTANLMAESELTLSNPGETCVQYNIPELSKIEVMKEDVLELGNYGDRSDTLYTFLTVYNLSNNYQSQNVDSGYGTFPSGSVTSKEPVASEKRRLEDINIASTLPGQNGDTATTTRNKRSRLLDRDGPRLACPFYKSNPFKCKNTACGGHGYISIHRLKGHLRQAHLIYRCDRCKTVFDDKKGAEKLKHHRQASEACELQSPQGVWGIDEETLNDMRPRKGVTQEERWTNLYCVLFQVNSGQSVPSPCKSQTIYHLSRGRKLTTYIVDVDGTGSNNNLDDNSRDSEHQTIENWSREVLRLLPDRLSAAIDRTVHEDKFRSLWKQFTTTQLHEILRETLKEAAS
jgi:hypothetical protein